MYAVINHLHLTIPVEEIREKVDQELVPLMRTLPGFVAFYLTKDADDRATAIILWDSATAADNGGKVIGPSWFAKNVAPYLASDQVRTVSEVVVSS